MHMAGLIGAVCGGFEDILEYSCNGGLSLRRVDAMLRCVGAATDRERLAPEDVTFSACLLRTDAPDAELRLADKDSAFQFAVEEWGDHQCPVAIWGMHLAC